MAGYNEDDDEFLRHFDENGNFIEKPVKEELEDQNTVGINYIFKKNKEKDS